MSPSRATAPFASVRVTAATLGVTALLASSLGGPVTTALDPAADATGSRAGLAPATGRGLAAAPTTPTVREFALTEMRPTVSARRSVTQGIPGAQVVTSRPRPVTGYGVVGASWEGDRPDGLRFAVRTRTDGAGWSPWQVLHGGDCPCASCTEKRTKGGHGPDAGTAEFRNARPGTDALAVGDVDEVQLRLASLRGAVPDDLTLAVVDPAPTATASTSARTSDAAGATSAAITLAASSTYATGVAQPQIFTRAQWGADERLRSGRPSYGTIKGGFVHHTVNANSYTREQVPSIIRGIYAYHTKSRGWSDIGYNFLVDRFGQIWEGRYGGIDQPVIGAHTYGYNHTAFAMSAIGNFDVVAPPSVMLDAYGKLFAWKLDLHDIPAKSTQNLAGKSFPAISGHRDAGSTACPGQYLYGKLPGIRNRAATIQAAAPQEPAAPAVGAGVARDLQLDGLPDLVARDRVTGQLEVLPGDVGPGFADRIGSGLPASGIDLFSGVGDVTGDGVPDLVTRVRRTGATDLRPGRPGGLFAKPVTSARTTKLKGVDLLAGAGNLAGNARPDLLARDQATRRLWVYPGKPGGAWGARRLLLEKAGGLRNVSGVGDLDGDGRDDVLAKAGRRLLLYPGLGRAQLGTPVVLSRAWRHKDVTVAGQDLTGDGAPNLLTLDRATGKTWIYTLQQGGRLGPRFGGWSTWTDLTHLTVVGDPGTGRTRLLGRAPGGIVALDARGTGWFKPSLATGLVSDGTNFLQLAGDWNGDGHADVLTRSTSTGHVWLYRGTGDGRLLERTLLHSGWGDKRDLVVTADLTGDERPDLLARDADGTVYVYPSDGAGGTQQRRLAHAALFATDLVTPAGFWDGDGVRDLIVRNAADKRLYLVPGTTTGTLGTPVPLSGDFAAYDRIVGTGDFNGDGHPDLLARESSTGRLWLFPGKPGGLAPRVYVAGDLGRFDLVG